jgi:acid phosphatase type 7
MTLVFEPVADARVEEANPTTNYGTATRLGNDGDAGSRIETYLRFEVAGVLGTVRSATLRLYAVADGTSDGPAVFPAGTGWGETSVTWATRPEATGSAVADMGAVAAGAWVELDVTAAVTGNGGVGLQLRQLGLDGVQFYSRQGSYKPHLVITWEDDPVVMAAGDIACRAGATVTASTCRHQHTSDLLVAEPELAAVLALGDQQYEDGLYSEFVGEGAYDATWGRLKSVTRPVPGNHEYHVAGAPGYFQYFGEAAGSAGAGYYSFDVGAWHLIALNSEIAASAGSAQERWLRADLAATTQECMLAYWHRPRFSSGSHGSSTSVSALWQALYEARADVVLSAHDHEYERFALQSSAGQADAQGIREFVVGTGGASHSLFGPDVQPNSEVREGNTFGVLKLTLHASSYEWQFVPEAGGAFTDSGTTTCHDDPAAVLTVTPSVGASPLTVTADASRPAEPGEPPVADYTFDFGDGTPVVGPQPGAIATHTYTADGTYTAKVTVTDTAGRTATATATVVVESNLVRNPGFEADVSGWNTGPGTTNTLTRVAGGHTGEWAAAVANGSATATTCLLNDSPDSVRPTAAGKYTASLWVRADTAGATLKLRMREWSGVALAGSAVTQVALDGSWQRVSVAYEPVAPGASTLDFNAYVSNAPPGTCFYADDAMIIRD